MAADIRPKTIAFFDGQNFFRATKDAFGYNYPNCDVQKLAREICMKAGWDLIMVRFYTGMPTLEMDPKRNQFWNNWKRAKVRDGVVVFTRPLKYDRNPPYIAREKGIDVRLALDVVRLTYERAFDVALIFSQDSDLSEAVTDAYALAKGQKRRIEVVSAFPVGAGFGINSARAYPFERELYDRCIDPHDYRGTRQLPHFPKGEVRGAIARICSNYDCNPLYPVTGEYDGVLRGVYDHEREVSIAIQSGTNLFVFEIAIRYVSVARSLHHKRAMIRADEGGAWLIEASTDLSADST